jgi:predicted ATPase
MAKRKEATARSGTDGPYVSEVVLNRERVRSFDEYPFSLPAVRDLSRLPLHPKVTFLVGENGSGKSTLLEAIAVAWGFNAEGGTVNFNFGTRESHSALSDYLTLVRTPARPATGFFLRAESFFNVATEIENLGVSGYGPESLHEQSHGEAFFALFMHKFVDRGFYVLDEPEAALSPMRQLAMMARVHTLVRGGSQFVIATHSPLLITYPDAAILQLSVDGVQRVRYDETEHFFVTRAFLSNPDGMLRTLLGEPPGDSAD